LRHLREEEGLVNWLIVLLKGMFRRDENIYPRLPECRVQKQAGAVTGVVAVMPENDSPSQLVNGRASTKAREQEL
jgi:hypothetical protein